MTTDMYTSFYAFNKICGYKYQEIRGSSSLTLEDMFLDLCVNLLKN